MERVRVLRPGGTTRTKLLLLLLGVLAILAPSADAQRYQQTTTNINGVQNWRPTPNDPYTPILETSRPFILQYNRYFLNNIYDNAISWINGPGNGRRDFHYDLLRPRATTRRTESCPTGWLSPGGVPRCPQAGQQDIFRYEKATRTKLFWTLLNLQPGSDRMLEWGPNATPSRVKYSCDEFPPATWIQGGAGSSTRCAGFRCGTGINAEQNYQGYSHNLLRGLIIGDIQNSRGTPPNFQTEVVHIGWDDFYDVNGWPARVLRIDPNPNGGTTNVYFPQKFEKRSNETAKEWHELTYEEKVIFFNTADFEALRKDGHVTEMGIGHNHTQQELHELARRTFDMPLFGQHWSSEFDEYVKTGLDENDDDDDEAEYQRLLGNTGGASVKAAQNATQVQRRAAAAEAVAETVAEVAAPMLEKRVTLASIYGKTKKLPKLLSGATESELQKAVKVVEDAIAESTKRNNARYDHVARNRYTLRPGTIVGGNAGSRRRSRRGLTGLLSRDDESPVPQLLDVTPDLAAAAALVAEADAAGLTQHGEVKKVVAAAGSTSKAKRADPFWMEGLTRKGSVPWGGDSTYKVFRNVKKDYGAVGDGVTDDTAAIVKAMTDGARCAENCNGSTLKNAIVYFPAGTYLVSKAIEMPFGTQVIGDANSRPTIVASSRFIGLGVLSTDKYTGGGLGADGLDQEYYINTANFYRQIRNVIIDVTATRASQGVAGLHYQVAQATSTQNVDLVAKTGTNQRGMFAENGSGGHISDINFKGGNFCIYGGNQQFSANRLTFDGCTTAVQTIWDWGWVWKQVTVKNVNVGFQLVPEAGAANKTSSGKNSQGFIGSASFIDSTFSNVGTAIVVNPLSSVPGSGSTGLVIENVGFTSTPKIVADTAGKTLLTGGTTRIDSWASGPIYSPNRTYSMGASAPKYRRLATLLDAQQPNGVYYERARPQYEYQAASDFLHVKDMGAKGDGVTDDSAALNSIFKNNVGALIFVDAGTYILKDTVFVPRGSVIVGEAWSQFAASGSKFSDPLNPRPMLRVGNGGDVGSVELQDLIFTTQGPTPGAVLVEWNIKASQQGAAALWDCHARVGGATGSKLTSKECPAVTSGTNSGCQGASMLFHLTKSGSGYFENMWLWVADHDIDDPALDDPNNDMKQCSVYVSRGFLIESTAPTWLYGTASEHSVMYQYNFNGAASVYAGMLQTETPYYQPTPKPPEPFKNTIGVFKGDPNYRCDGSDFDGCDSSWAVMIRLSQDIYVSGAGTYSFFSTYTQNCIDSQTCQKALILVENNKANIRLQHIVTIGAKYMLVQDGKGVLASTNLNVKNHPAWSQISIYDLTGNQEVHISPNGATIIPLPHTTVPKSATLTLDPGVSSDIPPLPNDGNQNAPPGPGKASCGYCSFFRRISSTCCGSGGSLGNPIVIPANQPIPVDIELPPGFVPNQDIRDKNGRSFPNGVPLDVPVTIPAGTRFPVPFNIPANMPLGDGEDQLGGGGGDSGGVVWIDPSVWNMTSPTIFCNDFPCTIQFPPWPSATSTITYPIVTITDTSYSFTTTVTRKPITITQWAFSPYTITSTSRPQPTGTKSTTDGIIWFIYPPPTFASTKTWPPVTYTPTPGVTKTTKPDPGKTPHPPPPANCCPPPPPPPGGRWPSMTISVSFGRPSPTVSPCGFPAFGCPVDPSHPDDPGDGNPDPDPPKDPEDPDSESDDDGEKPCDPTVSNEGRPGGVSTQQPPTSTQGPKYKSPDPQNNKVDCYESGFRAGNDQMRLAAESYCKYTLGDFEYYGGDERFFRQVKKVPNEGESRVDLSLEVYAGCQWKYNVDDCVRYLSVPINSCNCNGVNGKQGGFVSNSCLRWRIDPNYGR